MKFIINEAVQLNPPIAMIILPAASKSCWHNVPPANTKTSSAATRITAVSSKLFIINLLKNNKFGKETKMDSSEKFSVTVNGEMIINSSGEAANNNSDTETIVGVNGADSTDEKDAFSNINLLEQIANIVTIIALFIILWEKASGEKQIVYKARNINTHSNKSCTRFVFWNLSRETLCGDEFCDKNRITISAAKEKIKIKSVNIISQYKNGYCNLESPEISSDKCQLNFDKINYKQGFVVDVIHTGYGKKDLTVSGSSLEFDVEPIFSFPVMFGYIWFLIKLFAVVITTCFAFLTSCVCYAYIAYTDSSNFSGYILVFLCAILFILAATDFLLIKNVISFFSPSKILQKAFKE